jgi:hypothetical protein
MHHPVEITDIEDEIYFKQIFDKLYPVDQSILYAKDVLGLTHKEIIENRRSLGLSRWADSRHRVDYLYKTAVNNLKTMVRIDNGEIPHPNEMRYANVYSFFQNKQKEAGHGLC